MFDYHAVLLDECGDEFGVSATATDKGEACDKLREDYPESRGIVQVESPEDAREREAARYARLEAEMNGEFYDEDDF